MIFKKGIPNSNHEYVIALGIVIYNLQVIDSQLHVKVISLDFIQY